MNTLFKIIAALMFAAGNVGYAVDVMMPPALSPINAPVNVPLNPPPVNALNPPFPPIVMQPRTIKTGVTVVDANGNNVQGAQVLFEVDGAQHTAYMTDYFGQTVASGWMRMNQTGTWRVSAFGLVTTATGLKDYQQATIDAQGYPAGWDNYRPQDVTLRLPMPETKVITLKVDVKELNMRRNGISSPSYGQKIKFTIKDNLMPSNNQEKVIQTGWLQSSAQVTFTIIKNHPQDWEATVGAFSTQVRPLAVGIPYDESSIVIPKY